MEGRKEGEEWGTACHPQIQWTEIRFLAASKVTSFSGYPGLLSSTDDYYVMDRLVRGVGWEEIEEGVLGEQ